MTMRDLGRMLLCWRRYPPAPVALENLQRCYAAAHGWKPEDSADRPHPRRATREDVMQMGQALKVAHA